jgi:hypothetical protein
MPERPGLPDRSLARTNLNANVRNGPFADRRSVLHASSVARSAVEQLR